MLISKDYWSFVNYLVYNNSARHTVVPNTNASLSEHTEVYFERTMLADSWEECVVL